MPHRTFIRTGAVLLILGGLLAFYESLEHDRTLPGTGGQARLHEIATLGDWVPLHSTVALGTLLSLIGYLGLYAYLSRRDASPWAAVAVMFAVVSTAISLVLISIDGFAMKDVAVDWVNAPPATEQTLFLVARALEYVNLRLFSVFVVVYFGLTFAAHGMALVSSDDLPAPMGWLAVVLGGVSFVAGSFQLIGGITVISIATFAAAWSLSSLWLVAVGAMVLRRTTDRAAAGDSVRP